MDYVQVIDGKITKYVLPRTGTLQDGSTVSGYHLLDKETLKSEGWLPVEEQKPDFNVDTEILVFAGYKLQEDKVIRNYVVHTIQQPESESQKAFVNPDTADAYEAIAALNERLKALEVNK